MEYPVAHDSEVVAYRDESRILELEQLRLTYNRWHLWPAPLSKLAMVSGIVGSAAIGPSLPLLHSKCPDLIPRFCVPKFSGQWNGGRRGPLPSSTGGISGPFPAFDRARKHRQTYRSLSPASATDVMPVLKAPRISLANLRPAQGSQHAVR